MKIKITQFPGGFRLNFPSRKTTYTDFRLQLFPGRKAHVVTTHDTITQLVVLSIGGFTYTEFSLHRGSTRSPASGVRARTGFYKLSRYFDLCTEYSV